MTATFDTEIIGKDYYYYYYYYIGAAKITTILHRPCADETSYSYALEPIYATQKQTVNEIYGFH